MKSLVSPYFAEYQDKEVKFTTEKLVRLMAQRF